MSSIQDAIVLMRRNCFFYKIDLCDAFYSLSVRKQDRRFLKFRWEGKLYQFTCLPMGFCYSPRIFCRVMKAPIVFFRDLGFSIVDYLDDFLGVEQDYFLSKQGCFELVHLLDRLGYTINLDKSILDPVKIIEFLGFMLNSIEMSVYISEDKCLFIISECKKLLSGHNCSIREVASVVGYFVAYEAAVPMARLFYRHLEFLKNEALSANNGDFDSLMSLDEEARSDLVWWIDHISSERFFIEDGPHSWKIFSIIETDASKSGWGGVLRSPTFMKTGGLFSESESDLHINILELMAILFSLGALCDKFSFVHIRIMSDNSTAVCGINKRGSCKDKLHKVIKQIWFWALERNIWLSAVHIPGSENVDADFESRNCSSSYEWCLDHSVFSLIMKRLGPCHVDLFASRLNYRLPKYVSRYPDPGACAVDAFYFDWSSDRLYIFPPFRLLGKILKKIVMERVEAVLILPLFMAKRLSSLLIQVLVQNPILVPYQALFLHQEMNRVHPLGSSLRLLACAISSIPGKNKAFLNLLEESSIRAGSPAPQPSTGLTLRNGRFFVSIEDLTH